jgi:hypothetical protein
MQKVNEDIPIVNLNNSLYNYIKSLDVNRELSSSSMLS